MNSSIKQRAGSIHIGIRCVVASVVAASTLFSGSLFAAGEVSEIQTIDQAGTPYRYSVSGETYDWGMGQNQIMEGFTSNSVQYTFASSADRVELRRHDLAGVSTQTPCGVFVERLDAATEVLKADYPSDGSVTGNCDMAAMLASRVINRGALDLFSNSGDNPKNVERVDYIYDRGVLSPLTTDALSKSGHIVAEKRGNNPLQIAVITSIDAFGQPASYGPLVFVDRKHCADPTICYGVTNIRHNYSWFQNSSVGPQGFPGLLNTSTESVGMAFVSLADLGMSSGQIYYGFSYFPADVDESVHTLVDVNTFPQDTSDEAVFLGDGPDIYGGVSGYFLADSLSVANGAVFKDENGDGIKNDNEAGISDIGLTLYEDTNNNGVYDAGIDMQIGPSFNTDVDGKFNIPGLNDGVYFLLLDEADADLPPGISVAPGTNPAVIVINGGDANGINFSFISDTGSTDSGAMNDGSGNADSGNADSGNADSGNADSGNADSGNADSGNADSGNADSGNADSGNADSGNTDSGNTDSGNTDSGNADSGNTDSGNTDSGNDDSGNTDSGNTDSGNTDSGNDDSGNDDSGNTDSGNADSGNADSGNTDSGNTDSGNTDSGNTDSGNTDSGNPILNDDDFDVINDGVNPTKANADTATVNHGSTAIIDVLANDSDASGNGLSIVSVSESANAEIAIENGKVVYTPNFGFYGDDSFLYVMEDDAGTQDTGTVSVEVVRYSDINNNGLNDFVECDCDDLSIEVGVEGSALGSTSLLSFMVLLLLSGLRLVPRARRQLTTGDAQ